MDSDNDNGHEDDDDERTATIMFRIMTSTNSLITQQGLRADQHQEMCGGYVYKM